jgi:hypothetical protein
VPGIEALARRQPPLMLPHQTVRPPVLEDNEVTRSQLGSAKHFGFAGMANKLAAYLAPCQINAG